MEYVLIFTLLVQPQQQNKIKVKSYKKIRNKNWRKNHLNQVLQNSSNRNLHKLRLKPHKNQKTKLLMFRVKGNNLLKFLWIEMGIPKLVKFQTQANLNLHRNRINMMKKRKFIKRFRIKLSLKSLNKVLMLSNFKKLTRNILL